MPRLIPLTPKASTILVERMGRNPEVRIVERRGNKILFSACSGSHCGWVDLAKDPDWAIVIKF